MESFNNSFVLLALLAIRAIMFDKSRLLVRESLYFRCSFWFLARVDFAREVYLRNRWFLRVMLVVISLVLVQMPVNAARRGGSGSANRGFRQSKVTKTNVRKPISSNPPNIFKFSSKKVKIPRYRRPF